MGAGTGISSPGEYGVIDLTYQRNLEKVLNAHKLIEHYEPVTRDDDSLSGSIG